MNKNPSKINKNIFWLAIPATVFILSSFFLALLGANIYRSCAQRESQQELNAATSYFIREIRQCEDKSSLRVATLGGSDPALVTSGISGDKETETWFFVYDGYLCSETIEKGKSISADSSDKIMPLKAANFEITDDDLIEIVLTGADGASSSVNVHLPAFGGDNDE